MLKIPSSVTRNWQICFPKAFLKPIQWAITLTQTRHGIRLSGYTIADLNEGLNLIETLIPESEQENILDQGKIENSTFLAVRKDGSRFPVSVYSDNIVSEAANGWPARDHYRYH